MLRKQSSRANSSPRSSASSHEDVYSERFFEPEYPPNDIKTWRSSMKSMHAEVPVYYAHATDLSPQGFFVDSSTLYAPHNILGVTPTPSSAIPRTSPVDLPGRKSSKHDLQTAATSSMSPMGYDIESPPTKRTRKGSSQNPRISGACTRCKRLKMKCTFADDDRICARCIVGGHECIVLGRKPRSPGMREILRKQIREKDTMIDTLLAQLNPTATTATPLSLNTSRLALTQEQRNSYRDVLNYLEKSQGCGRAESRPKIDVSSLEDESDYDEEEEEGESLDDDEGFPGSLFQVHPLPTKCAPAGLLAKAALETRSRSRMSSPTDSAERSTDADTPEEGGIGNLAYFEPGPSANLDLRRLIIERQAAPDILLSGLVANEDVGKLFQIYWKWINPVMPILDENIHTPASVLGRCPFLFTVICAVSSRFYEEKPDMYTMAVHFAKTAAANSFLDGWKTVEMCQAYALMAAYMPAARRWDEDRTWFYSGIAFRLAIDLDLNRPPSVKPTDERSEREILNRLRTYVVCYIMDRCFCINLGKAFMVPEDELIRNVASQFYGWKYQHKADGYLVSLVELFRIMTRFAELANPAIEARSASNDETDLLTTHKVFAEELNAWKNTAMQRCAPEHASKDPDDCLRMALMHSVYQYCRLVTFSAGLQQVMKRGKLKEDEVFFTGCLHAGSAVVNCVIDRILPTGFIRYSPEHVFALSAFGTAILMKCLRPEFASKLDGRQEARIFDLIKRLLKSMDPEQLTTDDQVTPRRCYAKFLQQLLTSRMVEREQHRIASQLTMAQDQYFGEDRQEYIPDQVEQMHISPVLEQKPLQSMDPLLVNVPFTNPWDPTSNQAPNAMNALLGFSESEYMPTFMAFPDQTWFM